MPTRDRSAGPLREPYGELKRLSKENLQGVETSVQLGKLIQVCLRFLSTECVRVPLTSKVPKKKYYSYARKKGDGELSRPINAELFEGDESRVSDAWDRWMKGKPRKDAFPWLAYTMALAYCAAADLFDRGNKKAPATYFEMLVGHFFARELGRNPDKKAILKLPKKQVRMTMDFVFEPTDGRPGVHLPVKMSTRERVVQAWAHQRLLDAAYGEGRYLGLLVVGSETKLDLVKKEVVEICVPDQWLAYQSLLARMERIYYFDVPERYRRLSAEYPIIQLKEFSHFFLEREEVLGAGPGAA